MGILSVKLLMTTLSRFTMLMIMMMMMIMMKVIVYDYNNTKIIRTNVHPTLKDMNTKKLQKTI
jgi:hypothetical protein